MNEGENTVAGADNSEAEVAAQGSTGDDSSAESTETSEAAADGSGETVTASEGETAEESEKTDEAAA